MSKAKPARPEYEARTWYAGPGGHELGRAEILEFQAMARSRVGRIITHSANPNTEEDLVQDAVLRFLLYWQDHELEHPERVLRTIARRQGWKYRTAWEQRRAWPAIFADDDEGDHDGVVDEREPGLVDDGPDAFSGVADREALEWAVRQLDPDHREIAELAYLRDPPLDAKQIARRLGLAHGTVRNRQVAIRRVLQVLLADDD